MSREIVEMNGNFDIVEPFETEHQDSLSDILKIYSLMSEGLTFPCTFDVLEGAWKRKNYSESLDSVLRFLVGEGLLSINILTATMVDSLDILHEGIDEDSDYVVVYMKQGFRDVVSVLRESVVPKSVCVVTEDLGFSIISETFKTFISCLRKDISNWKGMTLRVEAFEDRPDSQNVELDLIISDPAFSEISEKRAKVEIGKVAFKSVVESVNVYKESPSSLYVGLVMVRNVSSKDVIELASFMAYCINELLEV